jgi:O-antigen/teichoic acid export membrane protein
VFDYTKRLVKHSAIYGLGNLLNRAVAFFLLPVYTRSLGPEGYGILEILITTSAFLLPLLQIGIGSALFRSVLYFKEKDERTSVSTAFYFVTSFSLCTTVVLYILSPSLSALLFRSYDYTLFLRMIFIITFLNALKTVPFAKLRIENKSVTFSIFASMSFCTELLFNIYFVAMLKRGVEGILLSSLLTSSIFAIVYLTVIFRDLRCGFSFDELKNMLGFGVPLVPVAFAGLVMTLTDRYFLKFFAGLDIVGIYAVGYKLAMIMALLVGAFQTAWPSMLFTIAKEEKAKDIFSRLLTYFLAVLFFIGMTISIFAPEIVLVVANEEFLEAARVVPFLTVGFICNGVYFMTAIGVQLRKKTVYLPAIFIPVALGNIALNYFLIPRWGMIGAACVALVSYLILALVSSRISLSFYLIRYEYVRILKLILVSFVVFFVSLFVGPAGSVFAVSLKIILCLLWLLILIGIRFFQKRELNKIIEILRQPRLALK